MKPRLPSIFLAVIAGTLLASFTPDCRAEGHPGIVTVFIDEKAKTDQPFFVNVWPDDVHSPFFPPVNRWGDRGKRTLYYAVLDAMDQRLARLFDRIRDDERPRQRRPRIQKPRQRKPRDRGPPEESHLRMEQKNARRRRSRTVIRHSDFEPRKSRKSRNTRKSQRAEKLPLAIPAARFRVFRFFRGKKNSRSLIRKTKLHFVPLDDANPTSQFPILTC